MDDVIACVERVSYRYFYPMKNRNTDFGASQTAIGLSEHLASQGGDAVVNLSPFISSCT